MRLVAATSCSSCWLFVFLQQGFRPVSFGNDTYALIQRAQQLFAAASCSSTLLIEEVEDVGLYYRLDMQLHALVCQSSSVSV